MSISISSSRIFVFFLIIESIKRLIIIFNVDIIKVV